MKEIVMYLAENPEIIEKLEMGYASLLGVSGEDTNMLIELFKEGSSLMIRSSYWA